MIFFKSSSLKHISEVRRSDVIYTVEHHFKVKQSDIVCLTCLTADTVSVCILGETILGMLHSFAF